jgi:putative ABC transport system permease protein
MIKQYLTQAWAGLRQQKLISAVTVVGTALSIFLIMLVVMMQQVKVAPFAPESNRDRLLHVKYGSVNNKAWGNGTANGPMAEVTVKTLYQSLKTPEAVTIYNVLAQPTPVNVQGQPVFTVDMLQTDDVFWHIFDFSFTDGKPYDKATFDAGRPVAVLTESVARRLFGTTECAGQEFLMSYAPYRVVGVVKDVSTLATTAYAQMWIPYTSTDERTKDWNEGMMGSFSCTILAHSRADFPAIREEAKRKLAEYNKQIAADDWTFLDRERPYDQEQESINFDSSSAPDVWQARRTNLIIFLILLIVPAINLSSMTHSRLRQRVTEIGVRRAFGSTRRELMTEIVSESFVVTLLAGVLGLLLSVAFAYLGNHILFAQPFSLTLNPPMVEASILLRPSTFAWALFFCFVLNLLSSGYPAWRASRTKIVNALAGRMN